MPAPVIRFATANHAADVAALLGDVPGRPGAYESRARCWIDARVLRVAELDGRTAGLAVTEPSLFGNDFLTSIRVAPPARRRGVARALLETISAERTTDKLFTSTNLSNAPMQAVMQSLGWESVGSVYGLDEGDPELFYRAPPH